MSEEKCNGFRRGKPCENPTIFARGFCATCYKNFVQECKANGSWRPYMDIEDAKIERPKWEFQGDEAALIKLMEDQEKQT